jgi:hypothetical protein
VDQNYCIFVPLDIAGLDVSSSTVIQRLTKAGLSLKPRHVARKSFCEWPRKDLRSRWTTPIKTKNGGEQ